ncbi:MAG: hypothetical protein J6W00_15360 [Lentisphaeria bacterium]|nr:hypothetical protein [Lentisphaeria bacterium]
MKKWYLIGITTVLALLILTDFVAKENLFGKFSVKRQVQLFELKKQIRNTTKIYQNKNSILLQDFENKILTIGKENFISAEQKIDQTVQELTGYVTCAKLCYKMAKDKIWKTSDTQTAVNAILQPNILMPCQTGAAKIFHAYQEFCHKLRENNNHYRAKLALIVGDNQYFANTEAAQQDFIIKNIELHSMVKNVAIDKMLTAIGITLEIILIKETMRIIVKVGGHIAAKLISTTSAAAISATADGPLPVGDIIGAVLAIGGISWAAYDLYQMHVVLPKEMRSHLFSMIRDFENKNRIETITSARKMVNFYNQESNKITDLL